MCGSAAVLLLTLLDGVSLRVAAGQGVLQGHYAQTQRLRVAVDGEINVRRIDAYYLAACNTLVTSRILAKRAYTCTDGFNTARETLQVSHCSACYIAAA